MKYIIELGNNRHVADSMKGALKKAHQLATSGFSIEVWQVLKDKIRHIGSVLVCNPDRNSKGLKPIICYFARDTYGLKITKVYLLSKDGAVKEIDIMDIHRWWPYFPHMYYLNNRMSDNEKRKAAAEESYYHGLKS